MAYTDEQLKESLRIFQGRTPRDQIRPDEVEGHTGKIIDSMVQLIKHRDTLSLFVYNPTRTLAYKQNEVVLFNNNFYKALEDDILGTFDPLKWELINLVNSALVTGDSFMRTVVGNDFVLGDLVYFNGTTYTKAIANSNAIVNDTYALFIVKDVDGALVTFGTSGTYVEVDLGYTGTPVLFLSDIVAGKSTEVKPSTDPIQQVGFYTDGIFHFNPVPIKIEEEVPFQNGSLTLNGNILQLTDTVGTLTVDLEPLLSDFIDPNSFTRTIVANNFSVGRLAYYDGENYLPAIADVLALGADTFALFIVKAVDGDEVTFGVPGAIVEVDLGLTDASVLYLSDQNPGVVTDVRPDTDPIQQIGFYADGLLHFNPVPIIIGAVDVAPTPVAGGSNTFTRTLVGHSFSIGEMAYYDGTIYQKAIGDINAVTNDTFAVFVIQNVDGDDVTFATNGGIVEINLGFAGAPTLFLSDTTAGAVTPVEPSTVPYQQVGFYADGLLHFNSVPVTQAGSGSGADQNQVVYYDFAQANQVQNTRSSLGKNSASFKLTTVFDNTTINNNQFDPYVIPEDGVVKSVSVFFTKGALNTNGSAIDPQPVIRLGLYGLGGVNNTDKEELGIFDVPVSQTGLPNDGNLNVIGPQSAILPVPKVSPSDPDTAFNIPLTVPVEQNDVIGIEFINGLLGDTVLLSSVSGLQVSLGIEFN